jgi:hypothetical protein
MFFGQVKYGQEDEFLFETTCAATNDELIGQLMLVSNKRLQLAYLVSAIRELGKHGPMKDPKNAGVDTVQEQFDTGLPALERSGGYCADPSGHRTGNAPGPELCEVFERVSVDAEQYVDKKRAKARQSITLEGLDDKLANLSGAVTMAYPMGLPAWDSVKVRQRPCTAVRRPNMRGAPRARARPPAPTAAAHRLPPRAGQLALELPPHEGGLDDTPAQGGVLEPATATLWCAGREFVRGETVADRLGKNEKTKVVAKLQKPGGGAPAREPVVSEDERKAMMAHYFKRQEEMKALAEANDDDYLSSSWADAKALKNSLTGMGSISAPGVRK